MSFKKYRVVCQNCGKIDELTIAMDSVIDWNHSTTNFIISGRKRLDNQWGFQCLCGNNDIMTQQEQRQITNKQTPDPQEIAQIMKNLIPDKPKFELVAA